MTPVLSILCAVLVAVIAWQRAMIISGTELRQNIIENGADQYLALLSEEKRLRQQSETDAALLAEAHALLHDTAARGKDGRWLPWSERRAAWVKKCEVRG